MAGSNPSLSSARPGSPEAALVARRRAANDAARSREAALPALELIERALETLRARPSLLLPHFVGTATFWLAFLYFAADMWDGAAPGARIESGALVVSLAFLWMKVWQCVFATRVRATLSGRPDDPWTVARVARMSCIQSFVQPVGFVALPLAAAVAIPFGHLLAFHQCLLLTGDGREPAARTSVARAFASAAFEPRQNHLSLLALACFAPFVFLNVLSAMVGLPWLARTLLGVESHFHRSLVAMAFDPSFLAVAAAITHLCLDPVFKACHAIRFFLEESVRTGGDLLVELDAARSRRAESNRSESARAASGRASRAGSGARVATLLLLAGAAASGPALRTARAQEPGAPSEAGSESPPESRIEVPAPAEVAPLASAPSVPPEALDASLDRVLARREFQWRLPREVESENPTGLLESFFRTIFGGVRRIVVGIFDILDAIRNALRGSSPSTGGMRGAAGFLSGGMRLLLWGLVAILAGLVAYGAVLAWRKAMARRRAVPPVADAGGETAPEVDLEAEEVDASALDADRWLQLAGELAARGETRLAMRALYLGALSSFAAAEFLRVARHKSDRDYARELERRARPARLDLIDCFETQMRAFQRAWYGDHSPDAETMERGRETHRRLVRALAPGAATSPPQGPPPSPPPLPGAPPPFSGGAP